MTFWRVEKAGQLCIRARLQPSRIVCEYGL
jgi:hypothetical protein